MKKLTKRIVAAMLCATVTAVNFSIGEVKTSVSVTADAAGSTGQGTSATIFDEREPSAIGNSTPEELAIRKADPYATTDSNGNGSKWAALAVVPEIYAVYGDQKHIVDYTNGNVNDRTWTEGKQYQLRDTTGLSLSGTKDEFIAEVGYETNGNLWLFGTCPNDNRATIRPLSISSSVNYLQEVTQDVGGEYLSIAAGDFDGDGVDSAVVYIPELDNPVIKEYVFDKTTRLDTSGNTITLYQPRENKTVSSDVYTDFDLTKLTIPDNLNYQTRNTPIVHLVADDIDKDGRDELIVTAGYGRTHSVNGCNSVMKIYDLVNGQFTVSYSTNAEGSSPLNDTYNGQSGRIRWAASAVGNVIKGSNADLGVDFPEIITAGWIDAKTSGTGTDMKKRYGIHITELAGLTKQSDGSYVGTYRQRMVLGSSGDTISDVGDDGVSKNMKNGFDTDWYKHEKLAVAAIAYKGPAEASALMIGDTVYEITNDNQLSAVYWSKDVTGHSNYHVRKLLTGYYDINMGAVPATQGGGSVNIGGSADKVNESAYFLVIDTNDTYAAYIYCYGVDGAWHTERVSTDIIPEGNKSTAVSICNVDVDSDSVYVKLKEVVKRWDDPKPLYVLEAAPYFREFPAATGSTGVGYYHESGEQISWSASISSSLELYFKQSVQFFVKAGEVGAGVIFSSSLTYEGSKTTSRSVEIKHTNEADDNGVVTNSVLMERTPMYAYHYYTLGGSGSEHDISLVVMGSPETSMMSVEQYNELATQYNNSHNDKQLPLIDSSFGLGTPGEPLTYRRSFPNASSNELFQIQNSPATAYYGAGGSTEKTISKSTQLSNGYNLELTTEAYVAGEVFGAGGKFTIGHGAGQGLSYFQTDSIGCTGTVARQNTDSRFNFNWDVARWLNKGIPVIGYKVTFNQNDISNIPPVNPQNLEITGKTNNSATLRWTNPATSNGRTAANHIVAYYKRTQDLNYTSNQVEFGGSEGEKTWTLSGLERNTTYNCYIANQYIGNAGASNESFPSNTITFTTNDDKELVDVTVTAGKGLTLRADSGSVNQSVDRGREEIKEIIYVISPGYQLPGGFYISSNGIKAQSSGVDVIVVSGTPTAAATIHIPDMSTVDYTISYNLNGGTLPTNPVTSYNVESETFALPKPVRTGYVFAGWEDVQGNILTQIPKGSTGNLSLEAKWNDMVLLGYTADYPADGSEQYPYIIRSENGWNFFCQCLEDDDFNNFSGKFVELGANIAVRTPAGSDAHKFAGIFDGCGNTLTFSFTANATKTAPFAYVQGTENSHAVIKNLNVVSNIMVSNSENAAGLVSVSAGYLDIAHCTVAGSVTTNSKYAGGFVGWVQGDTNITDSVSSITISSSINGVGYYGGFIGKTEHQATWNIEGCVFDGELLGNQTDCCGGFVGCNNSAVSSVKDSLFAPETIDFGNSLQNFVFSYGTCELTNCYYTVPMEESEQGKKVYSVTAGQYVQINRITLPNTETIYRTSGITSCTNGGLMRGDAVYAGEDDIVNLYPECTGSPTGYQFGSYAVNAGTLEAEDGHFNLTMPEEDVVITATFAGNSYTVHFDRNNAYAAGDMTDQSFTYGVAQNLTECGFTLPETVIEDSFCFAGDFLEWNTQADGNGTSYADKQSVQNLTAEENETVVLYAQWKKKYNIVCDTPTFSFWLDDETEWAYPGDEVSVSYEFSCYRDITVTGADGTDIAFDKENWTFEMPDQPVTVSASPKDVVVIKLIDINGKERKSVDINRVNGGFEFEDILEQVNEKIPSAPYLDGYTFASWQIIDQYDEENEIILSDKAEFLEMLASFITDVPDDPILIREIYNQSEEIHAVTVTGGTVRNSNGDTSGIYRASDQIYVTATGGTEEQKFSYWTKCDDGVNTPVIVGYEKNYAFRMPSRDTALTAVYEGEKIKLGTAYIESVNVHDTNKISFVSVVSVPKGATIERAGIVACMEEDLNQNHSAPSIDYARFKRYNDTTCKDYTSFKYTWTKGSVNEGDVWCVCAYLVYKDKDGEHTIYGEMVKADLNGIISEN